MNDNLRGKPDTTDYVPPSPEFDRAVRENEMRTFLQEKLLDEYLLEPPEADRALRGYLASRAEPLPEHPEPFYLLGAAGDAYAWWAGRADPVVVAVREAAQQVAAIEGDIDYAKSYMDSEEQAGSLALSRAYLHLGTARDQLREAIAAQESAAATDPSWTLYNTAYLAGAAATLAELQASEHPHHPGEGQDRAPDDDPVSAVEDLAAAEAAISLLRENRDRHGYTAQDAATARALRSVLDAAPVWDEVTSPTPIDRPGDLEEQLRPDRVHPHHPGYDDPLILVAGFSQATISVQSTDPSAANSSYQFLATRPDGRGPLRDVDTVGMGVIAAGDREPRPDRAGIYAELGGEVRQHLIGLADAIAAQREALHAGETRRTAAAQPETAPTVRPGHQRSL